MDNSLYLVAAGMDMASKEHTRIAHNLANVMTPGFKKVLGNVEGENIETEKSKTSFPYLQTQLSKYQGNLLRTNKKLDIALYGDGFLVASKNNQKVYIRSANLRVDSEGFLITNQGIKLQGESGPIAIDKENADSISINEKGEVRAGGEFIDTLQVVRFENPEKLVGSSGVYHNIKNLPTKEANPKIKQGYIEKSNVDSLSSSTDMLINLRYFGALQKVATTLNQSWNRLLDV